MAEAPPDYRQLTNKQFNGGQAVVPPGTAIPSGPAVAAYPTVGGPVYVTVYIAMQYIASH